MHARKKNIYKSLQKQATGIRRTVSTSAFFDADDVHSFRTHVKKVRAFLHWLARDKKTLPASFKDIYHVSGELRDIQVLLKAMEERRESTPAFTDWLQDNAGRLHQLWDDTYHPRIIQRLEGKLQHPPLKKPTAHKLRSFYNRNMEKIEAIVYLPAPDDNDLHDMRKILKDMYYVHVWGKRRGYTESGDAMTEVLEKLGEDCGQFNDRRIALQLLNAYLQQEKEHTAHHAAEQLRQRWEEERLAQKVELLSALRAFVEVH